MLVRSIKIKIL